MSQVQLPTTPCRGCRLDIAWVRTTNGKAMPIDPLPNPSGNVIVRYENGALVASVLVASDTNRPQGVAFMPHFATCTAINRTRKTSTRPAKAAKPPAPEPPPALF